MKLKPQDVLVGLKLLVDGGRLDTFADLARDLGISASEAHASVNRLVGAGLVAAEGFTVVRQAMEEFLIHGLRYVFPAKLGAVVRGVATSVGASPLAAELSKEGEVVPVWPAPGGKVRGYELKPLYRSVPEAAVRDPRLYEWLALADSLRSGGARERGVAAAMVRKRLRDG